MKDIIYGQALERIRAEMEEFLPYRMEYLAGDKMPADGLSRLAVVESHVISWEQIYHLQKEDKETKAIVCWKKYGRRAQHPPYAVLIAVSYTHLTLPTNREV